MKLFVFILLISLSASRLGDLPTRRYFIVWNVGQGLWTTQISDSTCQHFDFGGEFFPLRKMKSLCRGKTQSLYLSHWDWDHIGGLSRFSEGLCLAARPLGKSSRKKMRLIDSLPSCDSDSKTQVWRPGLTKSANANSQVFLSKNILIPGDSTIQQEAFWQSQLPLSQVRILVLGHHGSKTSTSAGLLNHLPRVRQAVSSARWSRYHHPHPEVAARLQTSQVALLKTEDWGNIWFEQDEQ